MALIRPRPIGYRPEKRSYRIPPQTMTSLDTVRAAIKRRLADGPLGRIARLAVVRNLYIVGANGPRCFFHETSTMANAIVNASSGTVTVAEYVFLGHGVQLLAGTHDALMTDKARQTAIPSNGYDVVIERGAWIASGAIVLGPCRVGQNSVVAAGAVVSGEVPPNVVVGGIPARIIKRLEY